MRRDARSRRSIYGLPYAGTVARLLLPPTVPKPCSPLERRPIASLVSSNPVRRRRSAAPVGQVRHAVRPSASAAPPSYRLGYTATGGSSGAPLHGTRRAFYVRSCVLESLQLTQLSFSSAGSEQPAECRRSATRRRNTVHGGDTVEVRNARKRLCPGVRSTLIVRRHFDIAA